MPLGCGREHLDGNHTVKTWKVHKERLQLVGSNLEGYWKPMPNFNFSLQFMDWAFGFKRWDTGWASSTHCHTFLKNTQQWKILQTIYLILTASSSGVSSPWETGHCFFNCFETITWERSGETPASFLSYSTIVQAMGYKTLKHTASQIKRWRRRRRGRKIKADTQCIITQLY